MRVARPQRREPEEPAERGQRGSARQRAQPAARRLRVARPVGEGQHQLAQRPQLLRRPVASSRRPRSTTCARSSRPTTRPTTPCWWWSATRPPPRCGRWPRSTSAASRAARRRRRPTSASRRRPPRSAPPATTRWRARRRWPMAWHLPPRMSKDFFALAVLDPLLVGDQSARLHQTLVRETRQAHVGGRRVQPARDQLGHEGPDAVHGAGRLPARHDRRQGGRPRSTRCWPRCAARASPPPNSASAKRALRSAFLEDLEGGGLPRFGRANLLGAFALFDDDPGRINTILASLDAVTARRREGGGRPVVRAGQPHHARQPPGGGAVDARRWAMSRAPCGAGRRAACAAMFALCAAASAAAQTPAAAAASGRGAGARVRAAAAGGTDARQWPEGGVARFATVPKVSVSLTFRSGLAADPAEKARPGAVRRRRRAGRHGRRASSRQLRDEVFAMGASLGAAVGQDSSTFTMRGLAETLPQMLAVLTDVVRRPTFPGSRSAAAASPTPRSARRRSWPRRRSCRTASSAPRSSATIPTAGSAPPPESVKVIDRAAIVAYHAAHYRAEQRVPGRQRRCRRRHRNAGGGASLRGLGQGRGRAAGLSGAAGTIGPPARVRPSAGQRAVVDLGRQRHGEARRPALVHAAAGQPDLRRRVRLAAGPQHP